MIKSETVLKNDMRFLTQTLPWQKRFIELDALSPEKDWNWIISHFRGDQDDLDHMFRDYGIITE